MDRLRLRIEDMEDGPPGEQGGVALRLVGEIDAHTAIELGRRLAAVGTPPVVALDLQEVTFIDSSGLRALLVAHRDLAQRQATLQLRQPSDAVLRLLELTALDDHLNIV